jgi:small-conductance mechanosensitive channel
MDFGDLTGDFEAVAIVAIAIVIGLIAHAVAYAIAGRLAGRTGTDWDESVIARTRNPARLLFVTGAVFLSIPFLGGDIGVRDFVRQATFFVGILGIGWLLVAFTLVGYDTVMRRYPDDAEQDAEYRSIETQLSVLRRFGAIIIWIVAIALALLTIPGVQPLAASLLAGAGVMGIVLGVAAGPLIGNLIAGIQIALTQPIKIGDVVVIEGEWGTIGEITAAYVVVYIWDKRRLVVPLSQIVNKPVENWTRHGNSLLGTVKLYLDYRTPIEDVRTEYKRILDESGLWDGESWSVLVTGADDRTITVRALFSAPDASVAWSMRCLIREKLIDYLQREHPEALPTRREFETRPESA